MNLISCNSCGAVLDKNKIQFLDIFNDDGSINDDIAYWTGRDYVSVCLCPVCGNKIPEED